ncbi:MAG: glycosyltransferase family 39 protein [Spirochaetota bacterium]
MLVFGLIVTISLIKFIYSLQMEIIPDEAYYWIWSRDLQASYYDQGPGIALYIRLFTTIFGENFFALKLAAACASCASIVLVDRTAVLIGLEKLQRLATVLIILLTPGFFLGSMLLVHDSVLLLAWCGALYTVIRFLQQEKRSAWLLYLLFLILGIGFLGKHTMVFFAFSMLLWLVFTPSEYRLLKNPHLYIGIILGAIVVSPMLYWNIENEWDNIDAIVHLRSSGGNVSSKSSTGVYIAGQLFTFTPFWLFLFGYNTTIGLYQQAKKLFGKSTRKTTTVEERVYNFLLTNSLVLPLFFLLMSNQRVIQANWVFPAYPAMALVIGANLGKTWKESHKFKKIVYHSGLGLAILMNILLLFSQSLGKSLSLKLPANLDISLKFAGYKQAIQEIEKIHKEKYPNATLLANNYQDASIASWYLTDKPFVNSMNILQKNHYSYFQTMQTGKDYLIFHIQDNICEKSPVFFVPLLEMMFDEVEELPEKSITHSGKEVKRYIVWYGKGLRSTWSESFFLLFNSSILETHSQGLYEETKSHTEIGTRKKRLIQSILTYLARPGEMNCSTF